MLVVASSKSKGLDLDQSTIQTLFCLISFPDTYTTSLPDKVEYTIYTSELDNAQYKIDMQFNPIADYMFKDSPAATSRCNFYITRTSFLLVRNLLNL